MLIINFTKGKERLLTGIKEDGREDDEGECAESHSLDSEAEEEEKEREKGERRRMRLVVADDSDSRRFNGLSLSRHCHYINASGWR